MNVEADELTAEQWRLVEQALPDLHAIARSLARRCHNHTVGELRALAEDSLRRRVRKFDPAQGKRLIDFARREIRLDLCRAAFQRAHDRCVTAGLHAFDRHEEAIEHPDTATRFGETVEEKDARARALGEGLMGRVHLAHVAARASRTPEEAFGGREEWEVLLRDAEATAPGARALLVLLYEQDLTWDEAAAQLGIDTRQAQRIEEKVFPRLRALIVGRRRRT